MKSMIPEATEYHNKIAESTINTREMNIGNNIVEISLFSNKEFELWLTIEKVNERTFLAIIDNRSESLEDKGKSSEPIYFSHSPKELDEEVINEIVLECGRIIGDDINIKPKLGHAFLLIAENYGNIFNKEDNFESLYGSQTKERAVKIFKADPLAYFLKVLNYIHQGDEVEKEIMILAEFTAHVDNANTVPIFIKGSPGAGKSSMNNAVSKIIPSRFVQSTNSLSGKALFYNLKEMSQDYIKLVCNDFFDSDVVAFVKDWADTTEEPTLKHMTVINGEGVTLEINGKRGLSITSADAMTNKQVNRRMYHLNPQESEEHLKKTYSLIIKRSIEQDKDAVDNAIETANAVYDLIINDNYIVFNPWLEQIDARGYSPTRLKHILHLIKARTLIYRYNREEIIEGVLLGTKEDVERILELDNQLNYLQTSQLPHKAFEIVKYLPEWDYDETTEENMKHGITFNELIKITGESRTNLKRWVLGMDDILGLEAMGIVKAERLNYDSPTSPWILFKYPGIEDDQVRQYGNKALISGQIDAETTLRHFIACSPRKLIREDLLELKNVTLKDDEDVIEFLEMAQYELLVDNDVKESLNNPIADDFINEFQNNVSPPAERTSRKHQDKQLKLD